ncbi:MAG TPA: hypothetical protein VJS66_04640 [Burkholderiales bacterium]|nr:hypothetical protein [Burkholderiales bacterium]
MMQANGRRIRIPETSAREVLERWRRWRRSGRLGAEVSWPTKTMTGKFMDGMPGINCPTCAGKGKAPSARFRVEHLMLLCPTCEGAGKVSLDKTDPERANPASIRSTYRGHVDEVMVIVDGLVCGLRQNVKTEKHHCVLWAEYVSYKYETQEWKAAKLGLAHGYFRKLLHEAHVMIENGLRDSGVCLETKSTA